MEAELRELKVALQRAAQAENVPRALEVLALLLKITPTAAALKVTEAGIYVNKLRKHQDSAVVDLAKKILAKWKSDVGAPSAKSNSASINSAQSASQQQQQPSPPSSSARPAIITSNIHEQSSMRVSSSSIHLAQENGNTSVPPSPQDHDRSFSAEHSRISTPESAIMSPMSANGQSKERNMDSDNVTFQSRSDKARDAALKLLYNALCCNNDYDIEAIKSIVYRIEIAVLDCYPTTDGHITNEYKSQLRSLASNLKDRRNDSLRMAVLDGNITPQKLVRMTPADLAPDSLKKELELMHQENLKNAQSAVIVKATTDQFKCGKCKARKASYFQLQTRSADEPMTTFVECMACGHHWRFC